MLESPSMIVLACTGLLFASGSDAKCREPARPWAKGSQFDARAGESTHDCCYFARIPCCQPTAASSATELDVVNSRSFDVLSPTAA